jgi:hypothetical protein
MVQSAFMIEWKMSAANAGAAQDPAWIQGRIVTGGMMSSTGASWVVADTFRIVIYVRSVE